MAVKAPKLPEEEELLQVEEEELLPEIEALEETTLLTTKEIETVISPDVFTVPPVVLEDTFFSAEEAAQFGADLPRDWQIKVTPEGVVSILDPSGWEFLEGDFFISPEGVTLTLAQVEALLELPEEERILAFPTLPQVFEPIDAIPEVPVTDRIAELEAQLAGLPSKEQLFAQMPALPLDATTAQIAAAATIEEQITTVRELEQQIASLKIQETLGIVFPEQEIAEIAAFYFPKVEDISLVPPAERARVEEEQALAKVRGQEFIDKIIAAGRTPETELLLQTIFPGITPEDIEAVFAVPGDVFAEARIKNLDVVRVARVEDAEFDVLFNTKGERGAVEAWVLSNIFPKKAKDDKLVQGITDEIVKLLTGVAPPPNLLETAQLSFVAGWGTVISTASGTAGWLGWEGIAENLSAIGADLQENRPPNELGEFDLLDLLNPEFYATKVVELIPFALSLAPLAIGGFYAGTALATAAGIGTVWSWIIGGLAGAALSRPAESALEAGSAYDDAIARGKTPKEAREEANEVFRNNMLLAGMDAFQIAIALAPTPKWVPLALIKRGLVRTIIIGGKTVIVGLSEGGEEVYQDMISRRARGEEWKLDPVSKEVFALGMIMGMGMGLGGAVITNIVSEAKTNMTPEQLGDFEKAVTESQEEGFTTPQAELKALDVVAQTPEGAEVVGEAIETVKELPVEVTPTEVAPTPVEPTPTPPTEVAFQEQLRAELAPPTEIRAEVPEVAKVTSDTVLQYWNENLEKNPLRLHISDPKTDRTNAASFVSSQLEAEGDILREFNLSNPSPDYILEKLDSLENNINSRDWLDALSEADKAAIAKTRILLNELPAENELQVLLNNIMIQTLNRDRIAIKQKLPELRNLIEKALITKPPEVAPEVTPLQTVQERAMEVEAEIEGMQVTIRGSRLKKLLPVWKRMQRRKDQPADLTIKEYKDLTGKSVVPSGSLTKDKKHVYWKDALDSVVTEFGFETTDELLVELDKLGKMDAQLQELQIEREQVKEELAGFRLEPTAEEIEVNLAIPGEPKLTLAQIDFTLEAFGRYITEPSGQSAWELTQRLRSKTRAERANELKVRVQELIIEKGISPDVAIEQAIKDTMSGKLPVVTTDYLSDLTQEMRDVLFNKVYHTLKAEPFEMMSTTEALTNALLGKAIPRIPGIKGMSAFTRLERVFGDQPQVFEALQKGAKEGKSLEDIVEGVFRVPGQEPTALDPVMVNYLRVVGKEIKTAEDLAIIDVYHKEHPAPILPPVKPPVVKGMEQMPMIPLPQKHIMIRALKEVGATAVDIGSFMRANMASFDFSFWRQQAPLILNNKRAFIQANIYAWQATWSQQATEASWIRITRDPLFQLYEEADLDFLRPPPDIQTGIAHWKGIEEFGFVHGIDRPIPKFTARLPWVKLSARAFATGTNEHNWRIFKQHYKDMLLVQERIASGEAKLKPGEAFSMLKELKDYGKMLMDFTGRASLGKIGPAAPALTSIFFAPRLNLGRLLTPRHLISSNPNVRKAAWLNLTTFVGGIGGIILLGWQLGLWEVEWDPRSPNFAQIRIGNVRFDPWGGFRTHVVFLARVLTKTGLSGATGAEYVVDPLATTAWFARSKAAPLAAILADFVVGKTFIGEEFDVKNPAQWIERVAPFAARDLFEVYMRDPLLALFSFIPAMLGAGIMTYSGDWEENFPKLGLPKYPENLPYGITEPVYDVNDFYVDTAARFRGVDPETLTEAAGFPPYIKALVEAARIKEDLSLLANKSLVSINADIVEGTTFIEYYQMWLEREKIVATGDKDALKAFDQDERTRNAHLGNMTQQQYALLVEYHSIIGEKERAEFLEDNPELEINPRDEWLKDNPKENALLAVWGQADLLTIEAYDEFLTLADEFGIPDNALAELTLPPRESLETHFSYLEIGKEFGWNSWETQLLLAKDPAYSEWRGLQPIDTPIEALELKVKNRDLSDQYDSYNDKESPNYIEDTDVRETARDKLKADNPEWVDDTRRIEAIENEASDETIEEWVDRGRVVDEFTAGSSEAMVWLLDHPETFTWALEQGLLKDDGKGWNEAVLRINVEWAEWDDWYDAITDTIIDGVTFTKAQIRKAALEMYPEYAEARKKRNEARK